MSTFHRKVHYEGPKSMRSSGPIGARESARMQVPERSTHMRNMSALEQRDYLILPPAPQEKKQSFSRVADTVFLSSFFLRITQSGHFDHLGRIKK